MTSFFAAQTVKIYFLFKLRKKLNFQAYLKESSLGDFKNLVRFGRSFAKSKDCTESSFTEFSAAFVTVSKWFSVSTDAVEWVPLFTTDEVTKNQENLAKWDY